MISWSLRKIKISKRFDGYVSDKASELDMALEALEEKEQKLEQTRQAIDKAIKALMEKGMSEKEAKEIMGI